MVDGYVLSAFDDDLQALRRARMQVYRSFMAIYDEESWQPDYPSFLAYCNDRLGIAPKTAQKWLRNGRKLGRREAVASLLGIPSPVDEEEIPF